MFLPVILAIFPFSYPAQIIPDLSSNIAETCPIDRLSLPVIFEKLIPSNEIIPLSVPVQIKPLLSRNNFVNLGLIPSVLMSNDFESVRCAKAGRVE